ncbi:hypothetical protein [Ottowia thiooxydans]|uniref:hypothetical protein n=1 Tax=Ottowia thiooxydans TaxID=219182 RepID=UPI00041F5083|nr:hypothetical protein [Ottowia thiooxydans]
MQPTTDREKILAASLCEIRSLLAGYLGSHNEASLEVRQAAHLAYATHNLAQSVLEGSQGDVRVCLSAIRAADEMLGSEFSKTLAALGLEVKASPGSGGE